MKTIFLSIIGGLFIAFGALASAGLQAPFNGIIFSTGLLTILYTNTNLFTGSILQIVKGLSFKLIFRWIAIFLGNLIGCYLFAKLIQHCGYNLESVINLAQNKANLTSIQAFLRAIPCNFLVCLAVIHFRNLLAIERIVMVIFLISVFVICGFEHSVANMFYYAFSNYHNLLPVTLGNIVGGCLVALSIKQ